jgi:hypothetical protein
MCLKVKLFSIGDTVQYTCDRYWFFREKIHKKKKPGVYLLLNKNYHTYYTVQERKNVNGFYCGVAWCFFLLKRTSVIGVKTKLRQKRLSFFYRIFFWIWTPRGPIVIYFCFHGVFKSTVHQRFLKDRWCWIRGLCSADRESAVSQSLISFTKITDNYW